MYALVLRYYQRHWYSDQDVAKFVEAEKLTPIEYQMITGKPYVVEEG